MGLQLLDYLVDAFAQIFGLEVGSGFRALVLLPCVVVGIDTLVVREVYVLAVVAALAVGLPFDVVLVVCVIRQLV